MNSHVAALAILLMISIPSPSIAGDGPAFKSGAELKAEELQKRKYPSLLEKELWFSPSVGYSVRVGFCRDISDGPCNSEDLLFPESTIHLKVVEEIDPDEFSLGEYTKVQFDDGSTAYVDTWLIHHNLAKSAVGDIGAANAFSARRELYGVKGAPLMSHEYFFHEDPVVLKARLDAIENPPRRTGSKGR